jgi:acetoin utilization deacetylase AcuC-like enzyme
MLFVAENVRHRVQGFAFMLHEPKIRFCYLDWIASKEGKSSGGIGGALYDRVRKEAADLGVKGLFFECLPDEASLCQNDALLAENRKRLRFYEHYGARPIVGTAYEKPYKPDQACMPHLMFDGLNRTQRPERDFVRAVIRAILERKYAGYVPADYIKMVENSIDQDPVRLRDFRYVKTSAVSAAVSAPPGDRIGLVFTDQHFSHHIHEHGYVEAPVRIRSILKEIADGGLFEMIAPSTFSEKHITRVHDVDFVNYLRRTCREIEENRYVYPYVFPIRNKTRLPKDRYILAGYYCIDTFTPLTRHAYTAARSAVNCALSAAQETLKGRRLVYALVRPPGHHAEKRSFGGFCYFNNTAIVAQYLSAFGRVAILDLDYHHGNGQQDIFYRRADVLTVSIHGHPGYAYPYFSGFSDERGEAEGEGFNLNLPLPEDVDGDRYRKAVASALQRVVDFNPVFLVVALGFDTAKGDPTGTWSLTPRDFETSGRMLGELGLPTLVVQEGGYRTRTLGVNARRFFEGMATAHFEPRPKRDKGARAVTSCC